MEESTQIIGDDNELKEVRFWSDLTPDGIRVTVLTAGLSEAEKDRFESDIRFERDVVGRIKFPKKGGKQ